MGGTDDADRADAALARDFAGDLHAAIGGEVAERVVGVDDRRRSRRAADGDFRPAVDAPPLQCLCVVRREANAVAVHAEPGGMHHGARRGGRRWFVGTGLAQRRKGVSFEGFRRYQDDFAHSCLFADGRFSFSPLGAISPAHDGCRKRR